MTELYPPAAQEAYDGFLHEKAEAREKLVRRWIALSDDDWRKTKEQAGNYIAEGDPRGRLRNLLDEVSHNRECMGMTP